jgi:hypothetical protein
VDDSDVVAWFFQTSTNGFRGEGERGCALTPGGMIVDFVVETVRENIIKVVFLSSHVTRPPTNIFKYTTDPELRRSTTALYLPLPVSANLQGIPC